MTPQLMNEDGSDVDIQKVQTVPLRQHKSGEQSVIVSITEAVKAAGLEDGGSFRFTPGSVEEIGMLAALGSEETVDGRREQFARPIRREGGNRYTLRLVIPPAALEELVDPETIDWDDPPEVEVWAGDRLLAFDLAETEEQTVQIDRDADQEDDAEGSGE